jgi:SAM-dependent methyltransferase
MSSDTHTHTGAGGYDWLEIWRQMYDAEREQAEKATEPDFVCPADHWQIRAARFADMSKRAPQPDGFMRFLQPHLRPDDRVLDIGAGTGRYLPWLAQQVAHVIALEPSAAMRAHLEQTIAEAQLSNVEVIADGWPPADLPRVSVAISAHVLYSVREIAPFLQAMDASASRLCVLALMLRHINSTLSPFWQRFHGEPRHMLPCALEALNVLYQLGIETTLELVPRTPSTYASIDEALEALRVKLRFVPHPQRDAELVAAIRELLIAQPDGSFVVPEQPAHTAVLSWQPTRNL